MITTEKLQRRALFALIFGLAVGGPFAACSGPADLRDLGDPVHKTTVHKDAGKKDAGHKVDAGNPTDDDACLYYASIICAKLDSCTQFVWIGQHYQNTDQCIEREEISCLASLNAPDNASTALGTEHCGAAIEASSCNDFFDHTNTASACTARPGPRADGRACAFNGQCASTWCDVVGNSVCGVCAEIPDAGAACTQNSDCGEKGMHCSGGGFCEPVTTAGAACSGHSLCPYTTECVGPDAGPDAAKVGTCVQEGEAVGARCDSTLTSAGLCDEGSGYFCPSATDECASATLSTIGEKCGVTSGKVIGLDARAPSTLARCAAAGTCMTTSDASKTEYCVAPIPEGSPCDTMTGAACLSPARCVTTSDASTAGTCAILGVTNACN